MSLRHDIILKQAHTKHNHHIIFWETDTAGGSGWPFKLCGCGCVCSLLLQPPLSHLLLLISMETGPGVFSHIHTLAINQQVRPRSIPTHTHHSDEHKEHTHTETRSLITETSQSSLDLHHTSRLSGSDHISVHQSRQPLVTSQLLLLFGVIIIFTDDCSPVAASPNTRRLVLIGCSLFILVGMNLQELLWEFVV